MTPSSDTCAELAVTWLRRAELAVGRYEIEDTARCFSARSSWNRAKTHR